MKDGGMGERWEKENPKGKGNKVSKNTAYEASASKGQMKWQQRVNVKGPGKNDTDLHKKRDDVRKEQTVAEWQSGFPYFSPRHWAHEHAGILLLPPRPTRRLSVVQVDMMLGLGYFGTLPVSWTVVLLAFFLPFLFMSFRFRFSVARSRSRSRSFHFVFSSRLEMEGAR